MKKLLTILLVLCCINTYSQLKTYNYISYLTLNSDKELEFVKKTYEPGVIQITSTHISLKSEETLVTLQILDAYPSNNSFVYELTENGAYVRFVYSETKGLALMFFDWNSTLSKYTNVYSFEL